MNPGNQRSRPGKRSQLAATDVSGRPGVPNIAVPGIGVLRLIHCVVSTLHRSVDWACRWHQRRIGIRKLRALNDHYLADIGLDRSGIVAYVEESIGMGPGPDHKVGKCKSPRHLNRRSPDENHRECLGSNGNNPA